MQILESIADLRLWRGRQAGMLGFVPTMGYLHAGHLALAQAAREDCERTIASIFVNPTQFSPNEDLSSYPRDPERDLALLRELGIDAVFMPTPEAIYPSGYQTYVTVESVTQGLEGGVRPTHFRGVATVVAKLFNLVQPHKAYFGQKDAQQVVVIRRMVADLNIAVDIQVCPIVREADGLAMSSRNVYLNTEERKAALCLSQALQAATEAYENGERHPDRLREIARGVISCQPLAQLDYVSVADPQYLVEQTAPVSRPVLLSVAARVGKPRLLDNCLLPRHLNNDRHALTAVLGAV